MLPALASAFAACSTAGSPVLHGAGAHSHLPLTVSAWFTPTAVPLPIPTDITSSEIAWVDIPAAKAWEVGVASRDDTLIISLPLCGAFYLRISRCFTASN